MFISELPLIQVILQYYIIHSYCYLYLAGRKISRETYLQYRIKMQSNFKLLVA